jgi:hypothetical protein
VRKRIGIEIKNRKLYSALPADELVKPLRRIVLDLAQKSVRVGRLMKKEQQIDYVEKLDNADKPKLSSRSTVRAVESIREDEFRKRPSAAKERRKPDPAERRVVVARAAKLNVQDNKTAEILKELKRLKVDEYPHAIAVLLRVFLELSVDHHMDEKTIPAHFTDPKGNRHDKTLKHKARDVIDDLVASGNSKKDFVGIERAVNDPKSPLNIDLLNAYVHNRFVTPKPRDLLGAWNDAQRFFERIWA